MPHLCYALRDLGAANRGQTSFIELLRIVAGAGLCMQGGVTNSHQRAVDYFKICGPAAGVRRLRERLDESDVDCHHMFILLRLMRDTLDHITSVFSALAADYYRQTNEHHRLLSDTGHK